MSTMDCFATIEQRFTHWHYGHPKLLYGLIRMLQPEHIVEVGTLYGYAACYMARAVQENNHGRLYCIDDFSEKTQKPTSPEVWDEHLRACGVRDWATLIVGRSDEVKWPDKVDFAYIDGWHSYKACRADFERAAIRGAECICLDDVSLVVGVRQFVAELKQPRRGTGSGQWTEIEGLSQPNRLAYGEWQVLELFRDNGLAVCMRKNEYPMLPLYSQELDGPIGLKCENKTELLHHLKEASKQTGVDYWSVR